MRLVIALSVLLFELVFFPVFGQSSSEHYEKLFEQANALYTAGEVDSAATVYESILAADYESEALYYNLGNACYKQDQIARAILNYERALKLAPHNSDIQWNLEQANKRTTDKIDALPELALSSYWGKLVNTAPADTWAVICLLLVVIGVVFFALYVMSRHPLLKQISFASVTVLLVVASVTYVAAQQQKNMQLAHSAAIVMAPSVTVVSSPDAAGNKLFVVHSGTKVELLEHQGEWYRVRLADGNDGWMHESNAEEI